MIVLTHDERRRFTAYCIQESREHGSMAETAEKGLSGQMGVIMGKRERQKAAAFTIVGAEINPENWESVTIKKEAK